MNDLCKINTGDRVGSAWGGPEWTPYAQAIADHYPIQVPWVLSIDNGLSNSVLRRTQTTRPFQHDVLILGASALVDGGGLDNGNFIFLNITHDETGISWAVANKLSLFPLPAIAGMTVRVAGAQTLVMPIVRLPEAFFLPAYTKLKLDWLIVHPSTGINENAILTLIGVQLSNPRRGFTAPTHVQMPNGQIIEVGSRLPWFSTIPMGEYQSRALANFTLAAGRQVTQFLPPDDCDVEIHGAYSNFISNPGDIINRTLISTKITDMGEQTYWTPEVAPSTAVFGGEIQVDPVMPFTKPYLRKRGHRTQITLQNNEASLALDRATVTLRGVKLCEY